MMSKERAEEKAGLALKAKKSFHKIKAKLLDEGSYKLQLASLRRKLAKLERAFGAWEEKHALLLFLLGESFRSKRLKSENPSSEELLKELSGHFPSIGKHIEVLPFLQDPDAFKRYYNSLSTYIEDAFLPSQNGRPSHIEKVFERLKEFGYIEDFSINTSQYSLGTVSIYFEPTSEEELKKRENYDRRIPSLLEGLKKGLQAYGLAKFVVDIVYSIILKGYISHPENVYADILNKYILQKVEDSDSTLASELRNRLDVLYRGKGTSGKNILDDLASLKEELTPEHLKASSDPAQFIKEGQDTLQKISEDSEEQLKVLDNLLNKLEKDLVDLDKDIASCKPCFNILLSKEELLSSPREKLVVTSFLVLTFLEEALSRITAKAGLTAPMKGIAYPKAHLENFILAEAGSMEGENPDFKTFTPKR